VGCGGSRVKSLWCVCGLGEGGRSEGGVCEVIPRTGGVCRGCGLVLSTALSTDRARPGCGISLCVLQSLDHSHAGLSPSISGQTLSLRRHFALYQYPRP
jgi:hypothetical protein